MSAIPTKLPQDAYHQRHLELVKKLTEKTRAKKIAWKASDTGLSATVSGKLEINFVRLSPLSLAMWGGSGWALFTIRDPKGNQILRVDTSAPLAIEPLDPFQSAVREAVSVLYETIEQSLAEEIDKAIEVVDRI